jgi:hypothetical protein
MEGRYQEKASYARGRSQKAKSTKPEGRRDQKLGDAGIDIIPILKAV